SLLALLLVSASPALALPLPDDKLVSDGTARLEAGDADGAIALFTQAEKLAPKDPRPRFLRGAALAKKKDLDGTIKAYRAALSIDATSAPAHLALGFALWDVGKLDETANEFSTALRLDEKSIAALSPPVLDKLANALADKDDAARAEQVARLAIGKHPRSLAL